MVKTVKITTDNKISVEELPNWSLGSWGKAIRVRMQGKQRGLCGKGVGNEHSSKRIKQRPDSQGE